MGARPRGIPPNIVSVEGSQGFRARKSTRAGSPSKQQNELQELQMQEEEMRAQIEEQRGCEEDGKDTRRTSDERPRNKLIIHDCWAVVTRAG